MKFIDWFAGIGGFRLGMENAGHECVGFCEFDKFATASYVSMHCITDEQREYLATLDIKKRQKEILKDEYRNGEWYAPDIRRVHADDIPAADCWCFGFPCQDISVAGRQTGFFGNRSSLFFRVMYLLGQLEEEKKPNTLFIENVKNLLSVNGGWDFARLKDDGEESFTLTSQDRHGVLLDDGSEVRIRKLTPKECFRLQGWTDDYFEKAQFVNSDSQLYKQAGNGVTVNVIEEIAKRFPK